MNRRPAVIALCLALAAGGTAACGSDGDDQGGGAPEHSMRVVVPKLAGALE